jgi:hypothetical protein
MLSGAWEPDPEIPCHGMLQSRVPDRYMTVWMTLYQGALIMTHRDRAGDPPGTRKAAGDMGHRQGFPTPSGGPPARPERRLPGVLWTGAFGRRRPWLAVPRTAAPRAPGRKPWEAVSRGHYQRSLVLGPGSATKSHGLACRGVRLGARVAAMRGIHPPQDPRLPS